MTFSARTFLRLPRPKALALWLTLLGVASVASWELRKWNFFAPGGVLAESRPMLLPPEGAQGFWDGIAPLEETDLLGKVWVIYVWTFG